MDWNLGEYEVVANQLEPAARAVVMSVEAMKDRRVLDLGCGTGNAATLAASRGATVTGVDPAPRLLGLARERAANDSLNIQYVSGRAEELPITDNSFDVVVSVFALIFASDPHIALSELRRVLISGGEVAMSTWLPEGALAVAHSDIIQQAIGGDPGPARFAWHDPVSVTELFAQYSLRTSFREVGLKFVASSARSFVETEWRITPTWVAARQRLEANGRFDEVNSQLIELFESSNEENERFAVTSPFLIITAS
jgi:ubiquinone/menaquinone biosynthesis C-methylase UbiE